MKISVTNVPAAEIDTDALVLGIPEDADKPSPWEAVDGAVGGMVSEAMEGPGFHGKRGETLSLSAPDGAAMRELVLVGLGPADDTDVEGWRGAVAHAAEAARRRGNRRVAVPLPAIDGSDAGDLAAAAAEAIVLSSYRYCEYKEPAAERVNIAEVEIATAADAADIVERAQVVAEATCFARDLINTPSNAKRPDALAQRAVAMAGEHGLHSEVVDDAEAEEIGLNALRAVGGGSGVAPRLVILEHRPDGAEEPPIVLVGKGITFDTGGISIKPARNMAHMKADMSGAAAVYGTMQAIARLQLPRAVVGVTPLAENMPSAQAYRPSDIVRAYNGMTIEVLNTDAEGRMVLADALAYACRRYSPSHIVDLATLTGACVVTLGSAAAGLMGNDDTLCDELTAAGEATGERIWRLPMWDVYGKMVDSEVADMRNSAGRDAGAITAGKFLERFVGNTPWAHLDIAGTAFIQKATAYQPKGGTGFGVRLLTQWLHR